MNIELTDRQYRYLLDLVYIGNWVMNSTRENDRIREYDQVESLIFSYAPTCGMRKLAERLDGEIIPSRAFAEGGIHEAIADYEDAVFFDILAEELARRDMDDAAIDESNFAELTRRMDAYMAEFEAHGTDHVQVESDLI